ncbi:hypothetical protein MP478_04425 [Chryseobacterium sp. WG14]|uniref:hypothetical protein n=1 Tax=Chryseobacterium sp. WG14 TaxID=2926909 RepID=UPI00211F22B1|nr:hypothetical protein [Chryseobacterium sp. WG14]MCQ9638626.1 hypothetical protein [Chryseobacterium sp. WG14]
MKLQKNNDKRELSDIEWVEEFYNFLQGKMPQSIELKTPPDLTTDQAFSIVWYLQEHFPLLPDNIEQCDNCKTLFDSFLEGHYSEEGNEIGHHFCSACDHLAP